ncbi:MAG: PQQ-binding-like beta-propeller repeat protein [Candidatus Saliniplasma sp.]
MVFEEKKREPSLKIPIIVSVVIILILSFYVNISTGDSQGITSSLEAVDSPWPMYQGDLKRTGRSEYSTEFNTGSKSWSFSTYGRVSTSVTIGPDSTLYFGVAYNGTNHGELYAIDSDGTEKWSFNPDGWVRSAPTIGEDGTIYFGSMDNNLYAVNSEGSFEWKFETEGDITSSPAIYDGIVYITSKDGNLYAVNNEDGSMEWKFSTTRGIGSSPAVDDEGTVYFGTTVISTRPGDECLYAVNPDGTEKWNFSTGDELFGTPSIGNDGTIYVSSFNLNTDNDILHAIKPDGTEKWSFSMDGAISNALAIDSDGTIYFGYNELDDPYNVEGGYLYALDTDGEMKWSEFLTEESWVCSPSISSDGTIYIGSGNNKLYAVESDGTIKWTFSADSTLGTISSEASIGKDGTIYFGSTDYKVYALGEVLSAPSAPQDLQTTADVGKVSLSWNIPDEDGGSAIIEYKIYRGTSNGNLSYHASVDANITSFNDTDLSAEQTYYYRISAVNEVGEGNFTEEIDAKPLEEEENGIPGFTTFLLMIAVIVSVIFIDMRMGKREQEVIDEER